MKLRNRISAFLIIYCLIILSACQPKPDSVFFDPNTSLPGWRGIIPGETSMGDAISLINNMPDLDLMAGCTKQYEYLGFESIRCYLNNKVDFTLRAENDIVQIIVLGPSTISIWYYFFNPNSISLENAIKRLGTPELVINSGRSLTSWYDQLLINPEIGYMISYPPEYSRNKRWPDEINPKGRVWLVFYFNPEKFDELIDRGIIQAGITSTSEETRERIRSWKGYGLISELYPTEKN